VLGSPPAPQGRAQSTQAQTPPEILTLFVLIEVIVSWFFLSFPRGIDSGQLRVWMRRRTQRGKHPPPDSDPFDLKFLMKNRR
jgi:hypothetical protein